MLWHRMLEVLFSVLAVATADAAVTPIGLYTGVHGTVLVTHAGLTEAQPVKLRDGVLFHDLIETRAASSMRALLDDDTLLSLGAESRLEISEHTYDPATHTRSAVLRLFRGAVRALVSKFPGSGSKFEIHTTNAVAAARGTYFVVWVNEDGGTGIANIGDEGDVAFTAAGASVIVKPGQYSTILQEGLPAAPLAIPPRGSPTEAIHRTEVRQNIAVQNSKQIVESVGGVLEESLPQPRFLRDGRHQTEGSTDGTAGGGTVPAAVPGAAVSRAATPPAVVSGAVSLPSFSNAGTGSFTSGSGSINSGTGAINSVTGSIYSGSGSINSGPGSINSGSGSLNSGPGSLSSGRYK